MAFSYTESGNNTASSSWAVSHPAASTGDLLIFNIGWDDSTTTTGLTPPAGPNGETAVLIEDVVASSNTSVRGKVVYYKATGAWSAGTISFTPSASEQWSAVVIKVPAGEFDATTPIGAHNNLPSAAAENSPDLPSLSVGSSDGGGTAVGFMVADTDDPDGTITGWTERASTDRGAVGVNLWTRNAVVTNSESISVVTGATLPASEDWVSFIYIVRPNQPPSVTLNTPANAASISDSTPTLDFTGTDGEGNDVRFEVQINNASSWADSPATYYFDASDGGPSDPNTVWTNDANAFDGSTSTQATCSTNGSTSSNYLMGEGTNAVDNGGIIKQVRARMYTAANGPDGHTHRADIYTDGLAENLGTVAKTGAADILGWSNYTTLSTPTGGWTWAKIQALETKIYITDGGTGTPGVYRVEIEVTYTTIIDKISGGSSTTETLTTANTSWTAPVGVNSVQIEAYGGGGAGGGSTSGSNGGGSGGGGGAYSKKNSFTTTPFSSYTVSVGSGGSGVSNANGNSGGDTYFNDVSTVLAKGGVGGGARGGTIGSGGASGSGVGDTKYSGGNGGLGKLSSLGPSGGGGGGAGSTGNGGVGGDAATGPDGGGSAGTGTSVGGGNGGAGVTSGNNGGNGSTFGGGGAGGGGQGAGATTGGSGANGALKLTYTPGDSGFANPDVGGDTDPFTSGDNIQFTVQAGDALSDGTYYWRVRAIDPTGGNNWGAWSSTRSFTLTSATPVTVNAGVQTITSSQPTATVTTERNVTVNAGVQTVTSSQETIGISVGDEHAASSQDLSLSIPSPTIEAIQNPTVSVGVETISLSQPSPAIAAIQNTTLNVNVQSLTVTEVSPTVGTSAFIDVNVQSISVVTENIGISVGDGATPTQLDLTLSQPNPSVSAIQNVSLSLGVQTITTSQEDTVVSISEALDQSSQDLILSLPSPTISAIKNVTLAQSVQTVTSSQETIGISIGDGATTASQDLTLSQPSPSVTIDNIETLSSQDLALSQPNPTITAQQNISIESAVQTVSSSAISPAISIFESLLLDGLVLTVSAISPSVSVDGSQDVTVNLPVLQIGARKIIMCDSHLAFKLNDGLYTRI